MGLVYLLEVSVTSNKFHTKYSQKSAAILQIFVVTGNLCVAICAPLLLIFFFQKEKDRVRYKLRVKWCYIVVLDTENFKCISREQVHS